MKSISACLGAALVMLLSVCAAQAQALPEDLAATKINDHLRIGGRLVNPDTKLSARLVNSEAPIGDTLINDHLRIGGRLPYYPANIRGTLINPNVKFAVTREDMGRDEVGATLINPHLKLGAFKPFYPEKTGAQFPTPHQD